jgi:hypothetical protein
MTGAPSRVSQAVQNRLVASAESLGRHNGQGYVYDSFKKDLFQFHQEEQIALHNPKPELILGQRSIKNLFKYLLPEVISTGNLTCNIIYLISYSS